MWTAAARDRYKDDRRRDPSDLTDAEWGTIAPVMSVYRTLTADLREIVNACLYLEKVAGPAQAGPAQAVPARGVRSLADRTILA